MKRGHTAKIIGVVGIVIVVAILLLRTPGTDTTPPGEQYVGTAEEGCAPWDGAAVSMSLSPQKDTPFPSFYVSLWMQEFPSSFSFDGSVGMSEDEGSVSYCPQKQECETVQKAKITFEDTGEVITGTFNLMLQDGQQMKGAYEATWDDTILAMCG